MERLGRLFALFAAAQPEGKHTNPMAMPIVGQNQMGAVFTGSQRPLVCA